MEIKIGDTVRYLNSVGGGRVTRIAGQIAYVDDDGFETPVMLRECVVVARASEKPKDVQLAEANAPAATSKYREPEPPKQPKPVEIPFVETSAGEKLNVVLGFEADNLRALSQSTFHAYLVNDSNYCLMAVWLTRGDSDTKWTKRFAGTIEPGTQEYLGEIAREDLPEMDRTCVQLIAYKTSRPAELKMPVNVEVTLDTTKFAKLHAFRPNTYFDTPVIALEIVTDDVPRQRRISVDPDELRRAMHTKERHEQPVRSKPTANKPQDEIVVDLHIGELVDTTAGMSNADMLNLQIDKFREVMDANLRHPGRRIIFIHGKGNGVLRQALTKELTHRYKGHDVQDASFGKYGFGATQVTIRQLAKTL